MSKRELKTDGKDIFVELKRIFGFEKFKGNQEIVIRSLLAGNDTFVIMPTGGGKSLCYQLPALISEGTAIVVSPLISLMKNQVDAIRNFGAVHGVAHFLNSSLSKLEIQQVKDDMLAGVTKLLYVAPESLVKEENAEFLSFINISFYAIDEAHCISEWGHDFRPEYRKLREIINAIEYRRANPYVCPILALTATATPKVQQDIIRNLQMENAQIFISSFNRPNLYYEVRPKPKDTMAVNKEIIKFIKKNPNKSGIIYCLSRKKVEEVAETLVLNGIKALPYHAGLDSVTRAENQDKFIMEEINVIVATIAFGMGIDKPDVRFVIHYDMPKSLEGYYQETGRAGRDDGEGKCIAFYSEKDIVKLEKFLIDKSVSEREVAMELMNETISYAESSVCRRANILRYFGEEFHEENCGACDNCLNPKTKVEASQDIKLVIETILAVKEMFKGDHIVNIIIGINNTQIKNCKHHKLEQFGAGGDKNVNWWKAVIRQCIIEGFIHKVIESYGTLSVMERGRKYLEQSYPILVPEDHNYEEEEDDDDITIAHQAKDSAVDNVLFSILKDIRKSIATKENLPPYVIFEDRSLEDMTIQYPINEDEMKTIIGVGIAKAQKYGVPFMNAIKQYVEDNEIERPADMLVRSIPNKSTNKVYIIKSIDKKLPLDLIAQGKNLDLNELLTEIESIVSSGTKIDISYYTDENVLPEHREEILDVLRELQTDNIEEVMENLSDDNYEEEEIRLMRIVFLNKYGY
ncbi:MAG: DNA helicase RecQ [Bacteroidales bacterium]|jgi:ATP-dependent DNA helicase RecQ|nr:DNA helicase RecQ [Bacteroidales bacterium]